MTPIETIITLQQLQRIYDIHQEFGKVIDEETKKMLQCLCFQYRNSIRKSEDLS